jgi:hypothetical protein
MNYLQFNDRGKFGPEEQVLANYFGEGNYVGFYKKHFLRDKFQITKDDFISGDIDVMFHAMKELGIEYSYNDYPESLKPYLHREVWESTLGEVRKRLFNDLGNEVELGLNWFIKPKNKLKRFTGFVCETIYDLSKCAGAGNQTKIWCSEPVVFVDEFRCYFMKDTKPVIGCYKEDFDEKNRAKVHQFLNSLILGREFPSAFVLDLGILSTGEVALIEMNDAFSIGKYNGIDDETYAKFLITRWNELKEGGVEYGTNYY